MGTGAITSYFDVAQLVLYMFWIFFAGLLYYLIRENHREGYPLDTDRGIQEGWPPVPSPKTYRLADGSQVQVPRPNDGPPASLNADLVHRYAGSPIEPNGNPLLAGVGPGSYANRADTPDLDHHGAPKILPLALAEGCGVSSKDPDPRGMQVHDCHGDVAGTVRELWLDRAEMLFRYLEVEVPTGDAVGGAPGATRRVLLPVNFARITHDGITVHAILAEQFADVPAIKASDRVTLLEEERITAYYGAGLLYAEPHRTEPLV
jgi:photosynthetic reaction center H subunit